MSSKLVTLCLLLLLPSCTSLEPTKPLPKVNYVRDPAGCLWIVAPRGDLIPVRKDGLGSPQVCTDSEGKERPKPLLAVGD